MDSINSWINEDEVRKLAEYLSASPEVAKEWKESDYDGFAIPEKQGREVAESEGQSEIAQEMKGKKSDSLAGASALAASAGLLGNGKSNGNSDAISDAEAKEIPVKKAAVSVSTHDLESSISKSHEGVLPPLCDHSLNEVPVNVGDRTRRDLPSINTDKELGTFEKIDEQLTKTVKSNGICVIDRDGDVLYSSMKNWSLVAFTIDSMMESKLMETRDGEFGNIRMKFAAKHFLEFISVHSTRGVLVMAISMDQILGDQNAKYVAGDALKIANMS